MKRCGVLVIAMMVAVTALAETNVTSVNAVGFIRTTVPDGGYAYVSLAFNPLDGAVTQTIGEILPVTEYPVGMRVSFFRDGKWMKETLIFEFGSGEKWDPGTNEFIRGDAVFIAAPVGDGDLDVAIMGEVPSDSDTPILIESGFTGVGYAYPADIALVDSQLGSVAETGDRISWWDGETEKWEKSTYIFQFGEGEKWDPDDVVLEAGKGYFYSRSAESLTWNENKPYVWP